MLLKGLSHEKLEKEILQADKKNCKKIGPCGIGKKAIYLNSLYVDRMYYIPLSAVKRVFKRIAMSQGGFSGKGIFASIPYLVVVYDGGKEKQCIFKSENQVDEILLYIKKNHPEIPVVSKAAEKKMALHTEMEKKPVKRKLSADAEKQVKKLEHAREFLEKRPELAKNLSKSAKEKRAYEMSNPVYRWIALAIVVMGAVSTIYGIWALVTAAEFGIYFTLFGLSAVLLFYKVSVLPTGKNNRQSIDKQWIDSCDAMQRHISAYQGFPLPARYAHPITLTRMIRVIREERAVTCFDALEIVKSDLKALNGDVKISKEEYEEVMAIKPMFLIENYR